MLEQMPGRTNAATNELLSVFTRERASLHWEQAYTRTDGAVASR